MSKKSPVVTFITYVSAQISQTDINKLKHALGLDRKKTPYRNHYYSPPCTESRSSMMRLLDQELVTQNGHFFYVTTKGYKVLGFEKWRYEK